MDRLTKAAIATGGAAVLLVGGGGTLAYWTADASATGTALTSGTLTATDGSCDPWEFTAADGGGAVTLVVPGDEVQTTCTVTVQGTGDHLGVTAALADDTAAFAETNALATALAPSLATSDVLVDGTPADADGVSIADGASHEVSVTVTASFPYGSTADNTTNVPGGLTATLDDVTITVQQTHTPPA